MTVAAKTMCPGCGAKNDRDSRRCRICTAVLNPDAPEAGRAVPEPEPAPLAALDTFDADEINRQLQPARTKFGSGGGGLAARIAAANGGDAGPQAPPPPGTAVPAPAAAYDVDEPFDPDALFREMS